MKKIFTSFQSWFLLNIWDLFKYNLPAFIKNLWLFRKALWQYRWYQGTNSLFCFTSIALRDMAAGKAARGYEVAKTSDKKIEAVHRAAYIMECFSTDNFIELAEQELGPLNLGNIIWVPNDETPKQKKHNRKVFARARELEELYWKELWIILEGQDYTKFSNEREWDDQFDGSGLRGWWD